MQTKLSYSATIATWFSLTLTQSVISYVVSNDTEKALILTFS